MNFIYIIYQNIKELFSGQVVIRPHKTKSFKYNLCQFYFYWFSCKVMLLSMRLNEIISIILIFFVLGTNFFVLCHTGQEKILDFHFIVEPCESHDCIQNSASQFCEQENCEHRICSDLSIIDEFLVNQEKLRIINSILSMLISENIFYPEISHFDTSSLSALPQVVPLFTAVLRI